MANGFYLQCVTINYLDFWRGRDWLLSTSSFPLFTAYDVWEEFIIRVLQEADTSTFPWFTAPVSRGPSVKMFRYNFRHMRTQSLVSLHTLDLWKAEMKNMAKGRYQLRSFLVPLVHHLCQRPFCELANAQSPHTNSHAYIIQMKPTCVHLWNWVVNTYIQYMQL